MNNINKKKKTINKDLFSPLWIFMISSLVIGLSDILVSILFTPRFPSIIYMTSPLAITVIVFFLMQLVVLILVFVPLEAIFKLSIEDLSIFFSSFLIFFVISGSIGDLLGFQLSLERIIKLALIFLLSCLFAITSMITLKGISKRIRLNKLFQTLGFALPFIFLQLTILVLIFVYRQMGIFSIKALLLAAVFLFFVVLTGFIFHSLFNRKARCGFVLVLWLLALFCYFIQPSSPDDLYNKNFKLKNKPVPYIIIITIDSLRKDAVSSYNPKHKLTPNIDKFSKESFIFTKAIAPTSWTLPSMASMMTGMPPEVHQATRHHHRVTDKLPTLPGQLRKAGYYTAAIGINPTLSKKTNISQGFIYYDFYPKFSTGRSLGSKIRKHLFKYIPAEKLADVTSKHLTLDFNSFISTDKLTDLSIEWVQSNMGKNFFLWIHYFDPHVPYSPPEPHIKMKKTISSLGYVFDRPDDILTKSFIPDRTEKEWIKTLYESEVEYVDHNIGRLFNALKGMGIYENSFIILTSDHGEEFWDHGEYYHGHSLYNELIHIPLIIKSPGMKEGKRVDKKISLVHFLPTILDLCGIEMKNMDLYKPSFLSLLKNKNEPFLERPITCSTLRYGVEREAVFFGNFKCIISRDTPKVELYDISSDPLEQSSQAETNPLQLSLGTDILKNRFIWIKKIIKKFKIEFVEKNKKSQSRQIEDLKSLGYF